MLETILIGIVIGLSSLIVLIIVLGLIIGGVKNRKRKKQQKIKIESKKEVVQEETKKGDFQFDELDFDEEFVPKEEIKEPEPEIKHKPTAVIKGNNGVHLDMNEGVVVGSSKVDAGEYIVNLDPGLEEVKVRVSRYVKILTNGDSLVLNAGQKFTPLTGGITLNK